MKNSKKHYIGNKYLKYQPKSTEPVLIEWWISITETTIELYDIDDNGMLVPNKEKFQRYYDTQ